MSNPNPVPKEPAPTPTPSPTPTPEPSPAPSPTPTPAPEAKWPDTWRQSLASGDEKELKRLERFAAPGDIYKSFRTLEQRMSSGELKATTPYPETGTDEQKAAWRQQNGLPLSADKYEVKVEFDEAYKPLVDDFLGFAHAKNLSPETVNSTLEWYFDTREKEHEERAVQDKDIETKNSDVLRGEWGNDYRANINTINALLDQAPEDIKDVFLRGRAADGTPIGSHTGVLKWLAGLAREINPVAAVMPAGASPDAINDEIKQLESKMGDYNSDYWKGPNADKQQARYRDLVAARDKQAQR